MRKAQVPQYAHPADVLIGDTVRITWKTGAVERSITAKVAAREFKELNGPVILYANDAQEIFRYMEGDNDHIRVSILAHDNPLELSEMLELFRDIVEQ